MKLIQVKAEKIDHLKKQLHSSFVLKHTIS